MPMKNEAFFNQPMSVGSKSSLRQIWLPQEIPFLQSLFTNSYFYICEDLNQAKKSLMVLYKIVNPNDLWNKSYGNPIYLYQNLSATRLNSCHQCSAKSFSGLQDSYHCPHILTINKTYFFIGLLHTLNCNWTRTISVTEKLTLSEREHLNIICLVSILNFEQLVI